MKQVRKIDFYQHIADVLGMTERCERCKQGVATIHYDAAGNMIAKRETDWSGPQVVVSYYTR